MTTKKAVKLFSMAVLLLAATAGAVQARITLVTVPERDRVQLTIYNSADITLVRERRVLTFAEGQNRIEFSWANTLIDPTSVNLEILTNSDKVELIDVSFPPQAPNALVWNMESNFTGEAEIEITYFTSGLSWNADYSATLAPDEQAMDLLSTVTVVNESGEDYAGAQIRLVVGTIHLVEAIDELANRAPGQPIPAPAQMTFLRSAAAYDLAAGAVFAEEDMTAPATIIKEGLSEYFIYTIEGEQTVSDGWRKKLVSFEAEAVPVEAFYKFGEGSYAGPSRFLRLANDEDHKLGEVPLPDGIIRTYRRNAAGHLSYWGQAQSNYIPVGEEWEISLGLDNEVTVTPTLWEYKKDHVEFDSDGDVSGYDEHRTHVIEIANTRGLPILLRLDRNIGADAEVETRERYQQYDHDTIRFERLVAPNERLEIRYTVTNHTGTRVD